MEKFQKDEMYDLIVLSQSGNETAKAKLIDKNMGLVLSIAKKFYNRGYDKEDINQLGAMGLIKAIEKFDLTQNVRFSTYAVPVVLGEIKRFLRDDGPVKVSRSVKKTAAQIAHFVESEQKSKGITPCILDIAKALHLEIDEIITAQEATRAPESIYAERSDNGYKLEDLLRSDINESEILTKIDVKSAVHSLPQREKTIIAMRYFLDKPQKDVAKKLGISQVQVSRLEKKILEKLKKSLECES